MLRRFIQKNIAKKNIKLNKIKKVAANRPINTYEKIPPTSDR